MARRENGDGAPALVAAARTRNATVASARTIPLKNRKLAKAGAPKRQNWQDESWEYFDDVPEIKYSTWFLGNAMSGLRIFAAVRNPDDPEGDPIPVTDPASGVPTAIAQRAVLEVERLKSPLGGQGEILRELNMNLEIAAEGYLVGIGPRVEQIDDPLVPGAKIEQITPEQWEIKSISEVGQKDGEYKISAEPGDKNPVTLDPDADTIIRIWQRHPRWSNLPDCAMRGVLSECEALLLLSNQVKGEAKSHQGAGILAVPNELSFGASKSTTPEDAEEAEVDPFIDALMDALVDPIEDPSSAASVMPLVLRGPAEIIDKLKHISLSRDTMGVLEERIKARIDRLARGLNLPVEVVLGHQGTTFANAGQVDKDTFDDHLKPRCVLLCDALTVGFLQPNLADALVDPATVDRIIVWYDASGLVGKVDPADSADVGVDKGLISEESWRRIRGFSEDDAPDALELLIRSGLRRGILTADLTRALLEMLGIPIDVVPLPKAATEEAGFGQAGAELLDTARLFAAIEAAKQPAASVTAAALPSGRKAQANVGRQLMDLDRDLRARLLVAADRAMTRALERAGNRLKGKAGATRQLIKSVHPLFAAATLGPALVAQAGFTDDALLGDDAWVELERQFFAWGEQSQAAAIDLANSFTGFSTAERAALKLRQAADLGEAWGWMKEQLVTLAHQQLYSPDPHAVALGEFDPTSRVPTGLVRQAVARAGGATGITPLDGGGAYVGVNNGVPLGGIGTGDLITEAMRGGDASIEAYEWVYGPAFRASPFEDHVALDGQIFRRFDSDDLAHGATADWLPSTSYFPGDHSGCACDAAPVWVAAEDAGQTTQGPNA